MISADVEAFLREWDSATPYVEAHTSGSTGRPKNVCLFKSDMQQSARATCQYFGIDSQSHLFLPLSVGYIAGKMMVVRALVSGATLWSVNPSRHPLKWLEEQGVEQPMDLTSIVPAQVEGLLQSSKRHLVRRLLIGGAPLTPRQEERIVASGIEAHCSYGMTETCSHVALRRVGGDGLYEAMPGVTFSVDERGCLVVECRHLSVGRLVTNDVVELRSPSSFRWLGRYDNVINTGGIKVMAEEIERALRPLLGEELYYVYGEDDEEWGERPVLVVERGALGEDAQRIVEEARQLMPHYMVPRRVEEVGKIHLSQRGKIMRRKGVD